MRVYTAHGRPDAVPVLVREGFSFWAFLFGPLWLLAQRAWVPAAAAFAMAILIETVAPSSLQAGLGLLLGLAIGVFGRDLVRWSLRRRGFALIHVIAARDADAAMCRLLDADPGVAAGLPQRGMRA